MATKKKKQKVNRYKVIPTSERYYEYIDRLMDIEDQYIEYIDDGAFSSVFVNPAHKDVAVKVYNIYEDPKYDPYLKYLKWIENNATNPYVPKIYDVRIFDGPCEYDEGYYAVIHMERLYRKDMSHTAWRRYKELQQLIYDFEDDSFNDACYGAWLKQKVKSVTDPNLKKVLRTVASYSETYGAFIDLHRNNVMWRKNHPVIIDPIAA